MVWYTYLYRNLFFIRLLTYYKLWVQIFFSFLVDLAVCHSFLIVLFGSILNRTTCFIRCINSRLSKIVFHLFFGRLNNNSNLWVLSCKFVRNFIKNWFNVYPQWFKFQDLCFHFWKLKNLSIKSFKIFIFI